MGALPSCKHVLVTMTPLHVYPSLPDFGVRLSVTFHFICVHIIFSSVSVAEWPPFGK